MASRKKKRILTDEELQDLIIQVAREDTVRLVDLIKGKKNVSEFKIADKLEITVNQVRNMLYRLQDHSLVTFTRKKDKKKGWYIYFWTFIMDKADLLALKLKRERVVFLKKQISREENNLMFACPRKCLRCNLENAMELGFKCPECESVLDKEDTTRKMSNIRKELSVLAEQIDRLKVIEELPEPPKPVKKKPAKKKVVKKKVKKVVKKKVKKVVKKKPAKKKVVKKKVQHFIPN